MITVSCEGCRRHCCGMIPGLTPVLTPEEEIRFDDRAVEFEAAGRKMKRLAKKETGTCVFLHDDTQHCLAYEMRPLECRLYPFLLDFSNGVPGVRIDTRFCPSLATMKYDQKKLDGLVSSLRFMPDWVAGYLATTDC